MFDNKELAIIRWAIEVASDAVTIKSAAGEMDNSDAMALIVELNAVEEKVNTLLSS